MQVFDATIKETVTTRLERLEQHFQGDVAFDYGPIDPSLVRVFRDFIERLVSADSTGGWSSSSTLQEDYSSSLGPIDPQVFNGKEWVPALGYLDKVEQLLEKARQGQLTNAEFLILQNFLRNPQSV
jgi:hypothetical protein